MSRRKLAGKLAGDGSRSGLVPWKVELRTISPVGKGVITAYVDAATRDEAIMGAQVMLPRAWLQVGEVVSVTAETAHE